MKTMLSCETSLDIWKWKIRNGVFVRDFPQILKVQIVKTKPELAVPMRGPSDHDPNIADTVSHPSAWQASPSFFRDTFCPAKRSISCTYYLSKTPFMRDFPPKVKVEDMKTKVLRETSLKKSKWKMYIWRCEDEAFVRDFPQKVKVEDVKTKLSCEPSLKELKRKMWERSCRASFPSKSGSSK